MKTGSTESFVSALSSADDVIDIDVVDGGKTSTLLKPLINPSLLSTYTNYMQPVTCINWRQNVPSAMKKKFSLLKNLKVGTLLLLYLDIINS